MAILLESHRKKILFFASNRAGDQGRACFNEEDVAYAARKKMGKRRLLDPTLLILFIGLAFSQISMIVVYANALPEAIAIALVGVPLVIALVSAGRLVVR